MSKPLTDRVSYKSQTVGSGITNEVMDHGGCGYFLLAIDLYGITSYTEKEDPRNKHQINIGYVTQILMWCGLLYILLLIVKRNLFSSFYSMCLHLWVWVFCLSYYCCSERFTVRRLSPQYPSNSSKYSGTATSKFYQPTEH